METETLLEHDKNENNEHEDTNIDKQSSLVSKPPDLSSQHRIYICLALLIACRTFYEFMSELLFVQLYEQTICKPYYTAELVPDANEEMCKIPAIQNKPAFVIGLETTFDAIPGML